jgi:hypothetical protein
MTSFSKKISKVVDYTLNPTCEIIRDMKLVYYTIGFNSQYLDLLHISIESLRSKNDTDILVICDESLVDKCTEKLACFNNILIEPCKDSISAMDASMKKLLIFNYNISQYNNIIYIDSDILVDLPILPILTKVEDANKLYAFAEQKENGYHATKYFSLMNYTYDDYALFAKNKIYCFNCGLFAFVNTPIMKAHFANILEMVENHKGQYHYEQSFMNVYFNKRKLINTTVINDTNCIMNINLSDMKPSYDNLAWTKFSFRGKFFHFCYSRGADIKLSEMKWWKNKYFR